jgi:predicted nucleotidyltransferase
MYSTNERKVIFDELVRFLITIPEIEGVIQLGSSINGFKDEYSDLDFMLVYKNDFQKSKEVILEYLKNIKIIYLKNMSEVTMYQY